jgi:hypothetical protein
MAETIAHRNAEAPRNIGQKHDELVARIQSTFATGDYEDLFSPDDLDMVAICYEQVMEDNYYGG